MASYGSLAPPRAAAAAATSILDETNPTGPVPPPVPACGDSCPCCAWPKTGGHLGKSYWLCGCTKRPSFFPISLFVGPHWYYLIVSYVVIAIPTAVAIGVASLVSPYVVAVGCVLTLALYTFLSCAGCSNPRIIEKQTLTRAQAKLKRNPPGGIPPGLTFYSRGCNVYREMGSAHCNACDVCYVDVDHHCAFSLLPPSIRARAPRSRPSRAADSSTPLCTARDLSIRTARNTGPWVGKCIAHDNIAWFYAFLVAVAVQFVYCVFCAVACVLKFEVPRLFAEPLV